MQQFIRAAFKDLRPLRDAIVPALELEVEVSLSKGGPGESFPLPDNYTQVWLTAAEGYLFWNTGGDIGSGYLATGFPAPLFYASGMRDDSPALDLNLVFPMSAETVARIENLRMGRDAIFRAYFRLSGHVQVMQGHITPSPAFKGESSLVQSMVSLDQVGVPFHVNRLHLTDRSGTQQLIKIAHSRWAEDILPGLGWGVSKVIELPLTGVEDSLKETDKLLDEAHRKFFEGDWTGSLTASRKAMETLQPIVRSHINPGHADKGAGVSAEQKADDLTQSFEDLAKAMVGYQRAVRGVLHAGAHQPIPGATLERADAELGLMLALSVRRYVGVRMLPSKAA
jgi:hypothetical protein